MKLSALPYILIRPNELSMPGHITGPSLACVHPAFSLFEQNPSDPGSKV